MRILSIHASRMWYRAGRRTKIAEETDRKEDTLEECVVLFCCVEKLDEKDPEHVITSAKAAVQKRLGMLHTNRVMIYPYAHLTSTLGSPQVALAILKGLEGSLQREGVETRRAPFGWYKEFEIRGKGHPLADLSMTICPYQGTECDVTCPYCHHPFKESDAKPACTCGESCTGASESKETIL